MIQEANELFKAGKERAAQQKLRAKLRSLRTRAVAAASAVPISRASSVDLDFEGQAVAIARAADELEAVPAPKPSPRPRAPGSCTDPLCAEVGGPSKAKTRSGKVVVRGNFARANPFQR